MAYKSKTSTLTLASETVFEPYCELKQEEGSQTLVLNIPDFKKDQLRVQVNNAGNLKVSGEKPVGDDGKRKSRFLKETSIPQGCDINDIRAKFIGGQLHVIMPIKVPTTAPQSQKMSQQEQPAPAATPVAPPQEEVSQKQKAEALVSDEQKLKGSSSGNGTMGTSTDNHEAKEPVLGLGTSLGRLQLQKKLGVNFGVAVVALVAIGAYVGYNYVASSSSYYPPHIED